MSEEDVEYKGYGGKEKGKMEFRGKKTNKKKKKRPSRPQHCLDLLEYLEKS